MTQSELQALLQRVDGENTFTPELNAEIARLVGWRDVKFDTWAGLYRGVNPLTGDRAPVPDYRHDYNACLTVVPDRWVESYRRTFDNEYRAECYPRGDLKLSAVYHTSDGPASAVLGAAIKARIAMVGDVPEKADCPPEMFDRDLAARGDWEKDREGLAKGDLGWNIVANLRWLALQPQRPHYVPCGALTGYFLNLVADRFEKGLPYDQGRRQDSDNSSTESR